MEQILAFVLGVSMGVFVWTVVVAFRTASKVKNLEQYLQQVERGTGEINGDMHHRIDQEIDRVNELLRGLTSYIDSRADKLDSKIENNKHLLKG
jgi:hypothetical protein